MSNITVTDAGQEMTFGKMFDLIKELNCEEATDEFLQFIAACVRTRTFCPNDYSTNTEFTINEAWNTVVSKNPKWLKFAQDQGWIEKEGKKEKYYLRINEPDVAIGEGVLCVIVIDENGHRIQSPCLLSVYTDGAVRLYRSVNHTAGLNKKDMQII